MVPYYALPACVVIEFGLLQKKDCESLVTVECPIMGSDYLNPS